MKIKILYGCLCLVLLIFNELLFGQTLDLHKGISNTTEGNFILQDSNPSHQFFIIRSISIEGNKKTKESTILRELSFQKGDQFELNIIVNKFYDAKKQLMNTGLFRNVVVSLGSLQGYNVFVKVEVEEKWYIYPFPFLHPIDKSFHQWWVDKDRKLSRVNYGVKITHNNFSGRSDKLDLKITNGFTKELSLQYYGLFLDKEMLWSANMGISSGKIKEINYITMQNKQVALQNTDYLNSYFHSFLEFTYRPAIKTRHIFGVYYTYDDVADTIFKLNPHFSNNKNIIRYFGASYRLNYRDVDFIAYPTKGYLADVIIKKQGFNDPINLWQLTLKGSGYWPLSPAYFINLSGVGMVKLPFNQPYITRQFIGTDDQFLQGYEYYVIDGSVAGYAKATLNRPILKTHINIPSRKFKQLNYMPLKIYAKTFVNAGYVHSPDAGPNNLNNKMLYSAGFGIDIVAFTDFVIKLEWSFNQLGENGLYLHRINYY